ncbi:TPA: hypothetical protein ACKRF0_002548 [Proteus mirabilis]
MFNISNKKNNINFSVIDIHDFSITNEQHSEYDKSIIFNIELTLKNGFFNVLNCEFYYFELSNFIDNILDIINNISYECLFTDERNIITISFKRRKNTSDISVYYKLFEYFDSDCYITGIFIISEEKLYDIIHDIKPYLL